MWILSNVQVFLFTRLFRRQTWRSTFYLTTGLSAMCLILGMLSIDADLPSTEEDKRIDWLGSLIVTAGLVLVVFALSDGEVVGWSTSCKSLDTLVSEIADQAVVPLRYHFFACRRGVMFSAVHSVGTPPRARSTGSQYSLYVDPSSFNEALDLGSCARSICGYHDYRVFKLELLHEVGRHLPASIEVAHIVAEVGCSGLRRVSVVKLKLIAVTEGCEPPAILSGLSTAVANTYHAPHDGHVHHWSFVYLCCCLGHRTSLSSEYRR